MGTRCITAVQDGNREILCMYRQFDGYTEGHGKELLKLFKGYKITDGISGDAAKTANGMGCFAAQLVAAFKREDKNTYHKSGNGMRVGAFYLFAPESRELGEEFLCVLSQRNEKLWLDLYEGEVAFFGMPGTKPAEMPLLYSGFLDNFNPAKISTEQH